MDRVIPLIQELGFTINEAKAYTALLGCQPASAYVIAKTASIPSSKIYEIVNRMQIRGIFKPTNDKSEQTQIYVALGVEDFLGKIREQTLSQVDELLPLLKGLASKSSDNQIWPLTDATAVHNKAVEMVRHTRKTLLLSLWPAELDWLMPVLKDCEGRGAQIAMVHFGQPTQFIGATYHHPAEQTLYDEKGARGLTLVSDSESVLLANYHQNGEVDGAWSRNSSFVTVAEDYVKHDVYITKVTRFLDQEVRARFGDKYEHLRNVFDADA